MFRISQLVVLMYFFIYFRDKEWIERGNVPKAAMVEHAHGSRKVEKNDKTIIVVPGRPRPVYPVVLGVGPIVGIVLGSLLVLSICLALILILTY